MLYIPITGISSYDIQPWNFTKVDQCRRFLPTGYILTWPWRGLGCDNMTVVIVRFEDLGCCKGAGCRFRALPVHVTMWQFKQLCGLWNSMTYSISALSSQKIEDSQVPNNLRQCLRCPSSCWPAPPCLAPGPSWLPVPPAPPPRHSCVVPQVPPAAPPAAALAAAPWWPWVPPPWPPHEGQARRSAGPRMTPMARATPPSTPTPWPRTSMTLWKRQGEIGRKQDCKYVAGLKLGVEMLIMIIMVFIWWCQLVWWVHIFFSAPAKLRCWLRSWKMRSWRAWWTSCWMPAWRLLRCHALNGGNHEKWSQEAWLLQSWWSSPALLGGCPIVKQYQGGTQHEWYVLIDM